MNEPSMRDLIDPMLALLGDVSACVIEERPGGLRVGIGQAWIDFEAGAPCEQALERLAAAIEARIAWYRARAMLAASGHEDGNPLPLWLLSGSALLAQWLNWSHMEERLRRSLTLSDQPGSAPVMACLDRRSRRTLGQGAVRIRVKGGVAVAERIELVGRRRCEIMSGRKTRIRIEGQTLPDTVIAAFSSSPGCMDAPYLAAILDHPFIAASDLRIAGIRNEDGGVIITVEAPLVGLAPIPATALAAAPPDADPLRPWCPTAREMSALYELVDRGRSLILPR